MLQFPTGGLEPTLPSQEFIPCKLFIGGLSYDTTDASLASYFSQFGPVSSATVLRDPATSHSRGFGFVTFVDESGAQRVLAQSRNHVVDGRKVEAKIAFPKNNQSQQRQQQTQSMRPTPSPIPGYSGYGMGMQTLGMGLGLGLNDPYLPQQVGMGYDPVFNSQMSMNSDVYRSMQRLDAAEFPPSGSAYRASPEDSFNPSLNDSRFPGGGGLDPIQNHNRGQNNVPDLQNQQNDELGVRVSPVFRRATMSQANIDREALSRLRKLSIQQPSRLEGIGELDRVSDQLDDLSLRTREDPSPEIIVSGMKPTTTADELKKFFSAFGFVDSAEMLPNGTGKVLFRDKSSSDKILNYQLNHGNLILDSNEITLRKKSLRDESETKFLEGRQFARSNTITVDSHDLFEEQTAEPRRFAKVPLMRTKSVTQKMLIPSGIERETFEPPFAAFSKGVNRDDKMRSFSVIAGPKSRPLLRMQSDSGRRSSSFAEPQYADFPPATGGISPTLHHSASTSGPFKSGGNGTNFGEN